MKLVRTLSLFLLVCLLLAPASSLAAPQADPAIYKVYITNVRDGSFDVSWTTDVATNGKVTYGTSTPPTIEVSDGVASTTTHFVTINGLTENTLYYLKVSSGAATNDNGGAYYTVTTGPAIASNPIDGTVFGTVFQSNGTTPAADAIVYLQIQDADSSGSGPSQWGTARTDGSGGWFYNLNDLRTSNYQALFTRSSGDTLRLVAQGGALGAFGEDPTPYTIAVPSPLPSGVPDMILSQPPTAVRLAAFAARSGRSPALAGGLVGLAGVLLGLAVLRRKHRR